MSHFPTQTDPAEGSREIVDHELERQGETATRQTRARIAERAADAEWQGGLKDGCGSLRFGSGAFEGAYCFSSRFESGSGTNPEELIAAAEAGCFSMALSAGLERAGFKPQQISTRAKALLERSGDGFAITEIALETDVRVSGIDKARFRDEVEKAKRDCPVSRALAGAKITLNARQL
jgi:osmotically inducible protein OsmC